MLVVFQLESVRSIQGLYLAPQKNQMLVCLLYQDVSRRCFPHALCRIPPAIGAGWTWGPAGTGGGMGDRLWDGCCMALSRGAQSPWARLIPGDPSLFLQWQGSGEGGSRRGGGGHLWDGQSQRPSSGGFVSSIFPKKFICPYS